VKLLLDTHTLVWWIRASPRLSDTARQEISTDGAEVFVSIASAWEIAVKVGLGKWEEARELIEEFEPALAAERFQILPITVAHVRAAGLTAAPHRDPFDWLLAAQAQIEGCHW
jgi:PIN domain nuclease of toxin-antitoxin system